MSTHASSWRPPRARIVEAGDDERRRLGRDLHDGAQQELVGAVMSLKLAQRRWRQAPDEARDLVEDAIGQMESGIRDLRELAAGIHLRPHRPRAERRARGTRDPRVGAGADWACAPGRLPAPVETSAYFVVAEALTNAAKHARCSFAQVGVGVENGFAIVEVHDNGVGGPIPPPGRGCAGWPIASTRSEESSRSRALRGRHDGQSVDRLRRTGGRPVCGTPQPRHERRLGPPHFANPLPRRSTRAALGLTRARGGAFSPARLRSSASPARTSSSVSEIMRRERPRSRRPWCDHDLRARRSLAEGRRLASPALSSWSISETIVLRSIPSAAPSSC